MVRITLFILFWLFAVAYNSGQDLTLQYQQKDSETNQYETHAFVTQDIISDFGRRVTQGSAWHNGTDFNRLNSDDEDHGDPILNPFTGNEDYVGYIKGGGQYKILYIINDNDNYNIGLGFAHIFESVDVPDAGMVVDDFVLKKVNGTSGRYAIIFLESGNTNAIGENIGDQVTYGETTYTVTQLTDNQAIAPIGNSDAVQGTHLHVYYIKDIDHFISLPEYGPTENTGKVWYHSDGYYPDYTGNALEIFNIINDHPGYDITINSVNNITLSDDEPKTFYLGTNRSSVKIRIGLTNANALDLDIINHDDFVYTNTVMKVDNIDLYIKKSFEPIESYELIKGVNFESKIHQGGRKDSDRYPKIGNPESNTTYDIASNTNIGSVDKTGVHAGAYSTENAYDDFYLSDIYTRIHKDHNLGDAPSFASINNMARYPDGKYDLFVEVTDVNNNIYPDNRETPTKSILIDNFRPYINKMVISSTNGEIYNGYLFPSDSEEKMKLIHNNNWNLIWFGQPVMVEVETSEPMEDLSLAIPGVYINKVHLDDKKTWIFQFRIEDIDECDFPVCNIEMKFTGTDLAGNKLFNMWHAEYDQSPRVLFDYEDIPVRISETEFSGENGEYYDNDEFSLQVLTRTSAIWSAECYTFMIGCNIYGVFVNYLYDEDLSVDFGDGNTGIIPAHQSVVHLYRSMTSGPLECFYKIKDSNNNIISSSRLFFN